MILQLGLPGKLLFTAKLLTEKGFLFLVDKFDVGGQVPPCFKHLLTTVLLAEEGFLVLVDKLDVVLLHVLVEVGEQNKCSIAPSLLAHQLGRPVS